MRALVIIALFWWHFVVAALEGTSNNPASSMTGRCEHRCGNVSVTDVHIIGFFPCTDRKDMKVIPVDNCDGIERIPVMNLALEEINERSDLLPGYRIVVDYANSDVRNNCIHTVETVPHSLLTCSLVCSYICRQSSTGTCPRRPIFLILFSLWQDAPEIGDYTIREF